MKYFMAKMNHIKPTFLEGGEVWHDIDKFPMLDHTILVELQVKGSDGLIYRTQDVCVERADRFVPTMSLETSRCNDMNITII